MGGIIVPCSPLFKQWELTYALRESEAKAIVSLDLLHAVTAPSCKECGIQTIIVTSMHDFLPAEPTMNPAPMMQIPKMTHPDTIEFMDVFSRYPAEPVKAQIDLDDVVQLQFTGGTTGVPKGAILTHGAKLFKASTLVDILRANMAFLGNKSDTNICLAILPTFHIAGMLGSVDAMIAMGATQVLMVMFDPVAAMQAIDRYKIQFFQAAVPMNIAIMNHPERGKYNLSSLLLCLTTSFGIQLNEEIVNQWRQDTGGCMLAEAAYGLTETHTFDSFMPLNKPRYEAGCQGIPIPGQQIKIVSWEDKTREVPIGEIGEIVLKNPAVFKGYWNKPEATAKSLRDGWLYTGDMVSFDEDGYYYIRDRKNDMINRAAFNIYPKELEDVLYTHPAVAEAQVVGIPDLVKGEEVVACLALKPGNKTTESDIIQFCRRNMAAYKVPKHVRFFDALPKTVTGKLEKMTLRKILLEDGGR